MLEKKKKFKIDIKLLMGIIIFIISFTLNDYSLYKPVLMIVGSWIIIFRVFKKIEERYGGEN